MELLKRIPMPDDMEKGEITELLLREEYGYLPKGEVEVFAELLEEDKKFCAGKAVLCKLKLTCKGDFGEFSFPVMYSKQLSEGKKPCFININFSPAVPDKYQPTEEIIDHGYSILSFCYQDVTSDDGDFTNGIAGLIYPDGKRGEYDCGKIGLWAWAVMRVMDYAMTLPELDHNCITVAGHSRLGKTALLAGMLDDRFFCAYSNNSGCGGASIEREKDGEKIADILRVFPYWFSEHFAIYTDKEENLPFDQHFLLAANYPHLVYVASAEGDLWAGPKNEYLSCIAASGYYEKRGMAGFVHPDRLAKVGESFHEGNIGYHYRTGTHFFGRYDWVKCIEFLERK